MSNLIDRRNRIIRHGMRRQIKALPSVKPRKGKWIKDRDGIYHCSCCGTDYLMYELAVKDTHYCPNCGCRMEEGGSE